MKTLPVAIALLLATPLVAHAQPNFDDEPTERRRRDTRGLRRDPNREIARLERDLGLTMTEAQRKSVRAAILKRQAAMQSAQTAYLASLSRITKLSPDQLRAKVRATRQNRRREFNAGNFGARDFGNR